MAKIYKVSYNQKSLNALYEKRLSKNDYFGALNLLSKMTFLTEKVYYLRCATLFFKMGNYKLSIEHFYKYVAICSKSERARGENGLACAYYRYGCPYIANRYFTEQIFSGDTKFYDFPEVMDECLITMNTMENHYRVIKPVSLASFKKEEEMAKQLMKVEMFELALYYFKKIDKESDYYKRNYINIALCYTENKQNKKASLFANKAIEHSKNSVYVIAKSIFVFRKNKNKVKELIEILDNLKIVDNYLEVAVAYAIDCNADKVIYYAKKELQRNKYSIEALYYLGQAYYNIKNYNKAFECFKTCFLLRGNYMSAYYMNITNLATQGKVYYETLPYGLALPEYEINNINETIAEFVKNYGKTKIKPFEIINICRYYFEERTGENQWLCIIFLLEINDPEINEYLATLLVSSSVSDVCRTKLIEYFADGKIGGKRAFICNHKIKFLTFRKVEFIYENKDVFYWAYSVAVAKLCFLFDCTSSLITSAKKLEEKFKNMDLETFENELSFLMAIQTKKVKDDKKTREYFGVDDESLNLLINYKSEE